MAGAWPWRVALETLGYYAAAPPPHTLAKLMAGEKLPWVVARVEKALRREDDAADAANGEATEEEKEEAKEEEKEEEKEEAQEEETEEAQEEEKEEEAPPAKRARSTRGKK